MIILDVKFSGKNAITVLGKRLQFILSGIDFHRSDEADAPDYIVYNHTAVSYSSGKDDCIHLSCSHRRQCTDIFGHRHAESLQECSTVFFTSSLVYFPLKHISTSGNPGTEPALSGLIGPSPPRASFVSITSPFL